MNTRPKKGLSVLVVDENASMRSVLRSIVKGEGHEVVGDAAEGKTALAMAQQLKPDVVILELSIPGMGALEVMTGMQQAGLETAVVVISSDSTQAMAQKAFELGAIGSVAKPLNADRLLTTLDQVRVIQHARQTQARQGGQADAETKRCIIIDKDPGVRGLLKALLVAENVKVVAEAENGLQSLVDIDTHRPDLVFLDVDVPEVNGLNVLRCVRAVHPDIRIIMATSRAEGDVVKEALSQGVAGYLLKPFDSMKVLASVRRALGRS